jgi:outer membrane protein assembly factor BamB
MPPRISRHRAWVGPAVWALVIATGCGGSSGGSAVASTPASPPPSAGPAGSPSPRPTPSPSPSRSTAGRLTTSALALDGTGPIGLAIDRGTAWVTAPDSGDLLAVDLATGANRVYRVGPGGSHVLVTSPNEVLVARFDTGGVGEHLAVVAPESGAIRGVATGPLAGFDRTDDGRLWALGTEGEIVVVDEGRTRVLARTSIPVHPNEHLDAVAAAGDFWASSDTTAIRRLSGATPAVVAEIETGGGIPLVFANGLVWGARADELWGIDPATNAITKHVPLDGLIEILDLDISGDRAWIAARKPGRVGTVVGIDLTTGRRVGEADVSLPAGVVVAGDRVWVTSYETDELIGIEAPP